MAYNSRHAHPIANVALYSKYRHTGIPMIECTMFLSRAPEVSRIRAIQYNYVILLTVNITEDAWHVAVYQITFNDYFYR
jgi:hypothetical protein